MQFAEFFNGADAAALFSGFCRTVKFFTLRTGQSLQLFKYGIYGSFDSGCNVESSGNFRLQSQAVCFYNVCDVNIIACNAAVAVDYGLFSGEHFIDKYGNYACFCMWILPRTEDVSITENAIIQSKYVFIVE